MTKETCVAPHAGAWIETPDQGKGYFQQGSPPMRGRGLKQLNRLPCPKTNKVAPHAGAWIETDRKSVV